MIHIAFYISSHGFGHGVRSAAICRQFSNDVYLTLRTALPEAFFKEELKRQFVYTPGVFDCGCVHKDSNTVDIEMTLQTYVELAQSNKNKVSDEVLWCKQSGVSVIVTDIAPFPCVIAKEAHIPSIAVSNFTWREIYHPYTQLFPWFKPYLEEMKQQYAHARCVLSLEPANVMDSFSQKISIPLICRYGTNRRSEILSAYGIDPSKHLGLVYLGNIEHDRIAWEKLEKFDQWQFLGLYQLPQALSNYTVIDKSKMPYQDLTASVDCMIGKVGYGVYSECVSNATPLIYLARTDFAEYPFLEHALKIWGHGHCLALDEFYGLRWGNALEGVRTKPRPSYQRHTHDGAVVCAELIETMAKT